MGGWINSTGNGGVLRLTLVMDNGAPGGPPNNIRDVPILCGDTGEVGLSENEGKSCAVGGVAGTLTAMSRCAPLFDDSILDALNSIHKL